MRLVAYIFAHDFSDHSSPVVAAVLQLTVAMHMVEFVVEPQPLRQCLDEIRDETLVTVRRLRSISSNQHGVRCSLNDKNISIS